MFMLSGARSFRRSASTLSIRQQCDRRAFTASARRREDVRGLIYDENGDPRELIRAERWPMPTLQDDQVLLKVELSSVNPADINVVQGVYPAKPNKVRLPGVEGEVFVGGNEGFAKVVELPSSSGGGGETAGRLRKDDWVVFGQPQMGTWKSHVVCKASDVIKIERRTDIVESAQQTPLTPVMASTLQVNPPTAFRMLSDFVTLDPEKDAVIQNTANSAVGQLVAQMCVRKLGVPSINLVRERPDLQELKDTFGAFYAEQGRETDARAHMFTYEGLRDRQSGVKEQIKEVLGKRNVRLGLNALCGKDNENMVKLLAPNATLVTYGAMSRQPLSLPAGLVIFHNVSVRGFMMNKWYAQHSLAERQRLMQTLVEWYEDRAIEAPPHTIVEFARDESTEEMTRKARDAIAMSMKGMGGKKVFFTFK